MQIMESMLAPVFLVLAKRGIQSVHWVDDILLILCCSFVQAVEEAKFTCALLESLGFTINW
jgi:hypothetical protein